MRFLASTDLFTNYLTYVYMYVRTYPLMSVNEAAQPTATTLFGIRSRMTSAGWDDLEQNRRGAEIVMTIITGARGTRTRPWFLGLAVQYCACEPRPVREGPQC